MYRAGSVVEVVRHGVDAGMGNRAESGLSYGEEMKPWNCATCWWVSACGAGTGVGEKAVKWEPAAWEEMEAE